MIAPEFTVQETRIYQHVDPKLLWRDPQTPAVFYKYIP